MQARFRAALWEAVRSLFPEGAEVFGADRHGVSIRWPADDARRALRPHARPVTLFTPERVARALEALDDIHLGAVARRCQHEVLQRMTAYREDGEEEALLVYLHPRVLEDAAMAAAARRPAARRRSRVR